MREILFRGKKITSGEWVVGNYNQNMLNRGFDTIEDTENFPYLYYGVDHKTVSQYTGMKDKNSKRIFEGDIFLCDNKYPYEVAWCDERKGFFAMATDFSDDDLLGNFFESSIEVIGNIHDNPELLEVEE